MRGGARSLIQNPVLPGSNPDPSLLRVGEDYYLATSTFQWFPGVRLHHTRDLAHWRLIGHALTRPDQLDLRGVPDSGGIWAPHLSHDGRRFCLVYPLVTARGPFPNVAVSNYLVTAAQIEGPWSAPRFLHGRGWDPSLFHDQVGRSWLLAMTLDPRPGRPAFAGITMQELDRAHDQLVGPVRTVFAGTALGCTEAPQLYQRGERHYLVTAEGGTSWGHAVTVARGDTAFGPFTPDPAGPLLTSRDDAAAPLQKAGHASLVSTPEGEWYMAFLCARPLAPGKSSPLGRETGIAPLVWTADGWPRLASGGRTPPAEALGPAAPPGPAPARDEPPGRGPEWNTLRGSADPSWCRIEPGSLALRGREPLYSRHALSLVARRWDRPRARAEVTVGFAASAAHEAAGLVLYHDAADALLGCVTHDERLGRCVAVLELGGGRLRRVEAVAPLPDRGLVRLRAEISDRAIQLGWASGEHWRPLGPIFDAGALADDQDDKDSFTGAFVGFFAQDPARQSRWATFSDWRYEALA